LARAPATCGPLFSPRFVVTSYRTVLAFFKIPVYYSKYDHSKTCLCHYEHKTYTHIHSHKQKHSTCITKIFLLGFRFSSPNKSHVITYLKYLVQACSLGPLHLFLHVIMFLYLYFTMLHQTPPFVNLQFCHKKTHLFAKHITFSLDLIFYVVKRFFI
jgi:hypothetical protein